jgi:hypothetical protein
MQLKIGADPEIFLQDAGGKFISGHYIPCGTKEEPLPVANGFVQNDGMALEFNVKPSETKEEFVGNTVRLLRDLNARVVAHMPGAKLIPVPTCDFGNEYISTVPIEVSRLGCHPDFNAWTGMANPVPDAGLPFRTGSGHIHVGFTENEDIEDPGHLLNCRKLVKELDYYLGLPSLLWDRDNRRRELYGKAGAFRPKSYGIEYRVLSNAWLKRRQLMEFVFERTQMACHKVFGDSARVGKLLHERHGEVAPNTINSQFLFIREGWAKTHQDIAHAVLGGKNANPATA